MKGTRWIRLALCGFVAGVIWNLLSVLFLATFAPEFVASIQRTAPHPAQGGAFFYAIDLLMGIWAVWLCSAIAPRYGATPATAAIAGIAWWILKTLQSAKWAGLGFVELGPTVILLGLATLGATILASAAGSWLYSKVGAPSPPDLSAT